MPARKPLSLYSKTDRHKSRLEARTAAEAAMMPKIGLPMNAPARLRGHKRAAGVWRRLMKIYSSLEAQIVTALDWGLVENYCLGCEELDELMVMRKTAYQAYLQLNLAFEKAQEDEETDRAVALVKDLIGSYDGVLKIDARIDRKKQLLHTLSQSLFITPRSRAGVTPATKEVEPEDEFSKMFDGGISWEEAIKNSQEAGNGKI
jgi:phage terminase small subunit